MPISRARATALAVARLIQLPPAYASSHPALAISNGQHLMDTSRRLQDHDLTLFPQSRFRFFAGYSRNVQDGPALITVHQFDALDDEFPLFSDVNRRQSEYRVGGDIETLKRAYRTLARLYHPDVNEDSDSDERMKQINEAYQIISKHLEG